MSVESVRTLQRIWNQATRAVKRTGLDPSEQLRRKDGMAEARLDLRGLKCPLPALKTRKALMRLAENDILTVECTDPLAEIDIPHLLHETGDRLESARRDGELLVFCIRKRRADGPPRDGP